MAVKPCTRVGVVRQLDGSANRTQNCARATAAMLVRHGSRGIYKPSPTQIGVRMAKPSGWANVGDIERAVESYDTEMRKKGYRKLQYTRAGKWNLTTGLATAGGSKANLRKTVQDPKLLVHVVIDNGKLNRIAPKRSSFPGFDGRHAIAAGGKDGTRRRANRLEVRILDPGADGREPGIPLGPQWWPMSLLWQVADGAWSDKGGRGWQGGTVACAAPLPKPEQPQPEPELPPDPCAAVAEPLLARIDLLEDVLADSLAYMRADASLIAAIRAALGPNTAAAGQTAQPGIAPGD